MTATLTTPPATPPASSARRSTLPLPRVPSAATKRYGNGDAAVTALDAVSVDFHAHQFTAIMGPSGSGKSTLMHLVAGLDTLTSGNVYIGDTDLSASRRPAASRCCAATRSASSSRRSTWCRR